MWSRIYRATAAKVQHVPLPEAPSAPFHRTQPAAGGSLAGYGGASKGPVPGITALTQFSDPAAMAGLYAVATTLLSFCLVAPHSQVVCAQQCILVHEEFYMQIDFFSKDTMPSLGMGDGLNCYACPDPWLGLIDLPQNACVLLEIHNNAEGDIFMPAGASMIYFAIFCYIYLHQCPEGLLHCLWLLEGRRRPCCTTCISSCINYKCR